LGTFGFVCLGVLGGLGVLYWTLQVPVCIVLFIVSCGEKPISHTETAVKKQAEDKTENPF
jgi:hypothetical protein